MTIEEIKEAYNKMLDDWDEAMTKEERIKYLKEFVKDNANHDAFDKQLQALLEQVAKEQREICVKKWAQAGDTHEEESYAIINAPSPLKEETQ